MKLFKRFFGKKEVVLPEEKFIITLTEKFVKVEHPERETEIINWVDIHKVKIINTDQGPWVPDVWLTLLGKESGCLIPQGAKGYEEVFKIVSNYPTFNFENLIKSMMCTENEEFLLWERN